MTLFHRAGQWLAKQLNLTPISGNGGWWPVIRESFLGAWQSNVEVRLTDVLAHATVFACITLIASDIAKCAVKLVSLDRDGIWNETFSAAFSPFLRKPNRHQNRIQFYEQWMLSKLIHGNTYVLKERDQRGVVVAGYVLDPQRVTPLVAPDGSVFYELMRDDLSAQPEEHVIVPAREIIHDRWNTFYHPLVGLSPIYACGLTAIQALRIQNNSVNLFGNGSYPGGVVLVPGAISQEKANALKATWETNYSGSNVGRVAILGDGMKYEPMGLVNAVDAQLIEQLNWTSNTVCSTYKVPPYKVGVGPYPSYNNVEALDQQYYGQCLQILIEALELCLDEGMELPAPYGTELDLDNLMRMDSSTLMATLKEGIGAGLLKPNEGRRRLNYAPVVGGDTPYLQQQNYSLEALNKRDTAADPFATETPASAVAALPAPASDDMAKFAASLFTKVAAFDYAA